MTDGMYSHQQKTALYVSAFLDELVRWGVREVVVSPGSRSTPLAMCAYEMSRRYPDRLRLYVDVDERGASFFALGLAKSAGRPVALVCTSGTAVANYLPAVVEANTSRVPLLVLTGDRPVRLQDLGAPQTCDQIKIFGSYVRAFRQMPEPGARSQDLAFARQAAREAILAAMGPGGKPHCGGADHVNEDVLLAGDGSEISVSFEYSQDVEAFAVASRACARMAGPVHLNFPFDEPLKPDFNVEGLFAAGARGSRVAGVDSSDEPADQTASLALLGSAPVLAGRVELPWASVLSLEALLADRTVLVLAGEGTCETLEEAYFVVDWAAERKYPLLADPLSGLRSVLDECVIDNYDNVLRASDAPMPEVVIRFGRYPVSKHASLNLAKAAQINVVVDVEQTRDFNSATDVFVACTPLDFVNHEAVFEPGDKQEAFYQEWVERNDAERDRIGAVAFADDADGFEGAYVSKLLELIPEESLLFSANSMPIRAVDTFLLKSDKPLAVLCNRGQNGIDGTVSTALGAAQRFKTTTFLTGDFTMLHDLNALALRRELALHHGPAAGEAERSIVIVMLNNNGGAIFDMLPQASDEDYFERLFLVPQDVDFEAAVAAFGVPYEKVSTVADFASAYEAALAEPGINFIEVTVPLRGVRERYAAYQG